MGQTAIRNKVPLFDLYSMIVDAGKLSTTRIASLVDGHETNCRQRQVRGCTHLIFSRTFMSASTRFQTATISSLCRTLIVHPQISGHSSPSSSSLTFPSASTLRRPLPHSSNMSPTTPQTRSSHTRSATPFLSRIIHFPPARLRGSSHTGRRTPAWNKR